MRRAAVLALAAALAATLLAAPVADAAAPALGEVSARSIEGTAAVLEGGVNPEGLETTYFFEFSAQGGFSAATKTPLATLVGGSVAVPVREPVSGLSPNLLYHYRLVAANPDGTSVGGTSNFLTPKGFGFLTGTTGFGVRATSDQGGSGADEAGSHPFQVSFRIGLNQGKEYEGNPNTPFPDGDIRDLHIEAPPGLIENPNALLKCSLAKFHTPRVSPYETSRSGESCPQESQVGTVEVTSTIDEGEPRRFGLFNLEPAAGVPAQLGFAPFGTPIVIDNDLRRDADASYTLTFDATDIPQSLDTSTIELVLWGTPGAKPHDPERGNCLNETKPKQSWEALKGCKGSVIHLHKKPKQPGSKEETPPCTEPSPECIPDVPLAYLTMPHKCSGPLSFSIAANSWQQPGLISRTALNRDSVGGEVDMASCLGVDFEPVPTGLLSDTKASSPSGFNFRLEVDNDKLTTSAFPAPAPTKKAVVLLPDGVTLNPSVGSGLIGCAPGQYAAETAFSPEGAGCPLQSKIGDFSVETPLFDGFIRGAVYLAQPDDAATATPGAENPFDTLVALYLVAKLPVRGILVELAGEMVPDSATGRLTATFDGLPQLPYSGLNITFRSGQRAPLITPPACGPAATTMDLTPWVGNLSVHATFNTQIKTGIGAGPCPKGAPPFEPGVVAGGVNGNVNSFTPYFIHISRKDTEQEITSYSLVLPEGITGKLAGIPFCPDAVIEAARTKPGFAEKAGANCPAASLVGHTQSGYGVGNVLAYATGGIYLAGPYHGQPLSLVAINPATVGPFDLGTIVIRSAFHVDEHTAQLQIDPGSSDRIPHILHGVPLHLRDVRIYMDRPQFTHNPSSCVAANLLSRVTGSGATFESSSDDSTAEQSAYFQLLNCRTLGFDPKLGVRLLGGTKRRAYPKLQVTFAARGPKDSNLKEIAVSMPHAEFFAQEHIRGICTRQQFSAESCPAESVYGSAVAYTPLFDEPLKGPIFLRSSSGQIPDMVASLRSGAVHIVLEGAIGGTKKGGIRALFTNLPDEPIDRFVMTLDGGGHGLLQNSSNICANPPLVTVKALGQSDLGSIFNSKLRGQCPAQGKRKRGAGI